MEEITPPTPTPSYFESPPQVKRAKRTKIISGVLIFLALVLIAGASFYVYKTTIKPDPISLLPHDTAFYIRVKVNPENQQVKNLKSLLNKFPYYEKISQKIGEQFDKLKEETPSLKNLDFTLTDEIILALISPLEEEKIEELSLVLILPDPDVKKLEELAIDVERAIEESEDWEVEEETYKGRKIFKAIPVVRTPSWMKEIYPPLPSPPEPKYKPSSTFTNGHFFLASNPEGIKKIIDVAEDQEITKIFKKGKVKGLTSLSTYKKIREHLPKDYLLLSYGEINQSKLLKTIGVERMEEPKIFSSLFTSLKAALDLPLFKEKEAESPEKIIFAGAIIAERDELRSETYSLDLREEPFLYSQFSFENSLVHFLPEKIGTREIVLYTEGRDLKKSMEQILEQQLTAEQKREFEEALEKLEEVLEVNLKEDVLFLFNNNYAFFLAAESTGKENPSLGLIFEIEDEEKVKENLLKIKVPKGTFNFEDLLGPSRTRDQVRDIEKVGFTREIFHDLEIYSLPIVDGFGLDFSIKDKKLILTFTKQGLIDIINSFSEPERKVQSSEIFTEQFQEIPQNISSISYTYPYGLLGVVKNLVKFYVDFVTAFAGETTSSSDQEQIEKITSAIEELLDKGIAPYLKMVKSLGSYSYSPEKGLTVSKGRLIIQELSEKEKRETEAFWTNFKLWLADKLDSPFYY